MRPSAPLRGRRSEPCARLRSPARLPWRRSLAKRARFGNSRRRRCGKPWLQSSPFSLLRLGQACPGHPRLRLFLPKTWMPGTRPVLGPAEPDPSAGHLKQAELLAGKDGRGEQVGAKLDRLFIEAEALGGDLESPPDHPGIGPLTHHAFAPFCVVELTAARRAHQRQNAVGAVRAV